MDSQAADLAREFGVERVYEIGLRVLGYPPMWVDTPQELIELYKELKRG
jgi:hypothetical protein